jgi:hypothetical protein
MSTLNLAVLSFIEATLCQTRTLGWVLGLFFSLWTSAQASPQLSCDVTYAGKTHVLKALPVSDPYSVEAVDIGGRFFFKMVMVGRAAKVDHILVYAYLDQEPRPVIMQESKYLPPFRVTAQPYLLTGEQHLYAGPIERELIYRCWLGGVEP